MHSRYSSFDSSVSSSDQDCLDPCSALLSPSFTWLHPLPLVSPVICSLRLSRAEPYRLNRSESQEYCDSTRTLMVPFTRSAKLEQERRAQALRDGGARAEGAPRLADMHFPAQRRSPFTYGPRGGSPEADADTAADQAWRGYTVNANAASNTPVKEPSPDMSMRKTPVRKTSTPPKLSHSAEREARSSPGRSITPHPVKRASQSPEKPVTPSSGLRKQTPDKAIKRESRSQSP
jgi:hypothetical protein